MSKKKITIATSMNPFSIDKNKSPADNIFSPSADAASIAPLDEETLPTNDVHNVQSVQNVHNVHFVHPATTKKHIHLVLTQERYEMLEQIASLQHLTVTKCLNLMIEEQYNSKWKAVVEQINQVRDKLEKKSPKDGLLKL